MQLEGHASMILSGAGIMLEPPTFCKHGNEEPASDQAHRRRRFPGCLGLLHGQLGQVKPPAPICLPCATWGQHDQSTPVTTEWHGPVVCPAIASCTEEN